MTTDSDSTLALRLMRGGTSRGPVLWAHDLPSEVDARDRVLVELLTGREYLDGVGGESPTTNKVVVIHRPGADGIIDYEVGNLTAAKALDWAGTCGNMTSAVLPFLLEEGGVVADSGVLRNLSTRDLIETRVIGRDGAGTFSLETEYLDPAGSVTGKLLPSGAPIDVIDVDGEQFEVSIVDVTHPYAFTSRQAVADAATRVGRTVEAIANDIRSAATVLIGATVDVTTPDEAPALPRLVMVDPAEPSEDGIRLHVVAVSMGRVIASVPVTAALCAAAATAVPGTLLHVTGDSGERHVMVSGAEGSVDVVAHVVEGEVRSVRVPRTARTLLAGTARVQTR